jgi:hypothetical protein
MKEIQWCLVKVYRFYQTKAQLFKQIHFQTEFKVSVGITAQSCSAGVVHAAKTDVLIVQSHPERGTFGAVIHSKEVEFVSGIAKVSSQIEHVI